MKKILHIIPTTDFGGITTMILDIWKNTNKSLYQFDFVVFNKGVYHKAFIENGSTLYYQKYITKQGPIAYMVGLYKILKNNDYEVVHDHTGYRAVFTLLAARLAGIKCRVLHSHTNVAEEWNNVYLLKFLKKMSVINATKLVACSRQAGEFCFGRKQFEILYNPIDINKIKFLSSKEKAEFKKELGIEENDLVIGHIGRFVPVKNHQFMLNIASKLKAENINFKMLFIGEGPLEQEVSSLIEKNNLIEHVKLLGPRSDAVKLIQIFDKFLLPSHFEGFGIVLLETQACGVESLVNSSLIKDVDMNLGIIKYLDLNFDDWIAAIIEENVVVNPKEIKEKIEHNGFNVSSISEKMSAFYHQ